MRRDTESISQSVAAKLIRELRARDYGATPVNTNGKENSWDIKYAEIGSEFNKKTGTIWKRTGIRRRQSRRL